MKNATRPYYSYLNEKLAGHFDASELRALAFELGVEYDDLQGEARADKALSLIRHVDERVAWAHEERRDKDLW